MAGHAVDETMTNPVIGILRNWSLLATAQLLASVLAMAFMILVSRTLGDVEFGRLYFSLTLAALVGVIADLGLTQVLTRAVARDRAVTRPYLRRSTAFVAAVAVALYGVLLAIVSILGLAADVAVLVLLFGLVVLLEAFAQLLGGIFAGHERMLVPALTRVGANVLALVLVVPLLRGGAVAVALVLVLAALVRVAAQAIAVRSLEGFRVADTAPPRWRALLRWGAPFMATQGLGLFVIRVDVLILARVAGDASVGWYGAANRITEALNVIPIVLTTATLPVLSRLWSTSHDLFAETLRRTLGCVLALAVPLAVALFVFADEVVATLLTLNAYAPTVPIVRVQALMLPFVFVDYLMVCALMACGRERRWLAIVATACLLVPLLDWVFIVGANARTGNGGLGAAGATLLVELAFLFATTRALPAGTLDARSLRAAALATALGCALLVVLLLARASGVPWMAAAAIGVLAYAFVAMRVGLLPPDGLSWLRGLRRGTPRRDAAEVARGVEAT